jgi:hypothetical protein
MPSSEYFRRQADICLRLSLIASSEVAGNWLARMAKDYEARAHSVSHREREAISAQGAMSARITHGGVAKSLTLAGGR